MGQIGLDANDAASPSHHEKHGGAPNANRSHAAHAGTGTQRTKSRRSGKKTRTASTIPTLASSFPLVIGGQGRDSAAIGSTSISSRLSHQETKTLAINAIVGACCLAGLVSFMLIMAIMGATR